MQLHSTILKVLIICLLLLMTGSRGMSQTGTTFNVNNQSDAWLYMMQDPSAPFVKTQASFQKFWENRTDYKGNGWKVFKRWEYINEFRVLPNGKLQAPGYVLEEYNRYIAEHDASAASGGNWTIQGPVAYPVNNTGQPTGMGRLNTIAFHPTDANTIYVGAASGGIWKTTDGGSTWTNLSNNLPWLGVSSILIHPSNPDIIYIGTGDRDAADAPGIGVYKTADGGLSWLAANATMGNVVVGAMVMHPADYNTILAATSSGIFKTTDGGITWSAKLAPGNFKDIKLKPGDPTIVYSTLMSSGGARFYRSSNTGENWSWISTANGVPAAGSRMVIGVSADNSDYVYLVQIKSSDRTFAALLRSTDSGSNFTTMSTSPNIFDYACDGSGTSTQSTYDLCIAVDPNDADILYVGSINNWKSIDGGATWTINSMWAGTCSGTVVPVHADQHWYEWSPVNGRLYVANDGGLYWTANGGTTWTENSDGLAISQIYRIGQGASNANSILIGLQDNGSAATTTGNAFVTTRGGDGTECIIDYSNQNYCYNTYVNGEISRSVNGPTGGYSAIATTGTHGIGADESGAWVTPYLIHETKDDTMFAGYKNVWRSENVKASSASSVTWTAISAGETTTCRVMEQSPANTGILYVVRSGSLKRTDNANDDAGSVTWSACTLPGGSTPTDLEAHPTDPDVVYATAAYSVYKSTDRGLTWTDMDPSAELPELFTNCLVFDKNTNEGIYVGNQIGVWYKEASMSSWIAYSTGLPPIDVRELEIFNDPTGTQHRLKAATYGRGLWQTDLIELGIVNPTNFSAIPVNSDQIDLSWNLNTSGNNVILAFGLTPEFGTPVNGSSYSNGTTLPGGGTVIYQGNGLAFSHSSLLANTKYYYKLWSYDASTVYSGGTTANATTFCTLISSFPWSETFDHEGSMPTCWTQEYANGSTPWEMKTSGTNGHPASAHSGTYLARCRTTTVNLNHKTKFITPAFKLTEVSNPVLKFWHTQEFWASQDHLRVYYRTSHSGNWTLLSTYTNSIAAWTEETINLPSSTDTYFLAFEATVNAGYGVCIDDISITSGCRNPDVPLLTASVNPVCSGSVTNLSISSGNLNSATTWQWYTGSCGGTSAGTGSSITVNPTETTTYFVRGTGGCVTPGTCANITVNVNPILPVSVSVQASENPVCAGTSVTFSAIPVNGGASPQYQWLKNNQPVGTGSYTYTCVPANGDQVRVVLTSNETCISGSPAVSGTITMVVNPVLPVSILVNTSQNPTCAGTQISFTTTTGNEGTSPVYQWKVNGVNAGTNSASFDYTPIHNDLITCELTSNVACPQTNPTASLPFTMTVNANPSAISITPSSSSICEGSILQLTATGGTGEATIFRENFNGSITSWTLTNNSTGGTPSNSAWTVHPDGYVYDEAFHSNDNSAFIMSNSDAQGDGTTSTILESPVINLSSIHSPTLKFYHFYNHMAGGSGIVQAYNGSTWVTLATFDQATIGTASSFALKTISLTDYAGQAGFKLRFVYNVYWGWSWAIDNVTITAPTSITWAPQTGLYSNAAATIPYGGQHTSSVYAKPASNESYSATASLYPTCVSISQPATINVNPILFASVQIEVSEPSVCSGTNVTFTASPVNGGVAPSYQWYKNSQPVGTNSPTFNYMPTNDDQVYVIMTSSESCLTGSPATSNVITMTVNPTLPVDVSIEASTNPVWVGTSVTITATPVNGGLSPGYQWMMNGDPVGTNSAQYAFIPSETGNVTCILTSSETCTTGNPATSNPVQVIGSPAPVTQASMVGGCIGEPVDIPVLVSGFSNIGAVSLTLTYNPGVLSFMGWTNTSGYPLSVGGSTPGIITIGGYTNPGLTYPDNTPLLTLQFMYAGGTANLVWHDNGISCEYEDGNGMVLYDQPTSSFYINGQVNELSQVTQPVFSMGNQSVRCQDEEMITYSAVASNTTGMTWSMDNLSVAEGNTINASTGEVTWNTAWIGTSTITVTAEGCEPKSETHTVTTHPRPSATIDITTPIECFGGLAEITIMASGGTGDLLYTLGAINQTNNGLFTGIPAGPYTWSVSDVNGCGLSGNMVVNQPDPIAVSGTVKYNNSSKTLLGGISVSLKQNGITLYSMNTESNGNWQFANVCPGSYDVELSTTRPIGGVNAGDAAAVNYYGIAPVLTDRVNYCAGDFEVPFNKINATDAGSILAYFLNLYTPALSSDRGKWVFWPAGETIQQVNTIPLYPIPGPIEPLNPINVTAGCGPFHFYALVTGDFNRSYTPGPSKSGTEHLMLEYTGTMLTKAGTTIEIPLHAATMMEVGAISLIMQFPDEWMEIQAVTLGSGEIPVPYTVFGDELRIGWHSAEPMHVNKGDILLVLHVKARDAKQSGYSRFITLQDDPLNELANEKGELIEDAVLTMKKPLYGNSDEAHWKREDVLFSAYPNPFDESTSLSFLLPSEAQVSVALTDPTGRKLIAVIDHQPYTSGQHKIKLPGEGLKPGLYLVKLEVAGVDNTCSYVLKLIHK